MVGAKILIYGPSGGGKSSSNRNLNHVRTGYINPDRKDLPFLGWQNLYKTVYKSPGLPDLAKSNYVEPQKMSSVIDTIKVWEQRQDIDNIVVDTITHLMGHDFMNRILEVGFTKYSQMALNLYHILDHIRTSKTNKNYIVMAHDDEETSLTGEKKLKVRMFGKLMSEKVEIPSMFTTVCHASARHTNGIYQHVFITQADGTNFAKAPTAFAAEGKVIRSLPIEMPNDTQAVIDRLRLFSEGKLEELMKLNGMEVPAQPAQQQ